MSALQNHCPAAAKKEGKYCCGARPSMKFPTSTDYVHYYMYGIPKGEKRVAYPGHNSGAYNISPNPAPPTFLHTPLWASTPLCRCIHPFLKPLQIFNPPLKFIIHLLSLLHWYFYFWSWICMFLFLLTAQTSLCSGWRDHVSYLRKIVPQWLSGAPPSKSCESNSIFLKQKF